MKKILNTNIVTFLHELQEAIREGCCVVPGKSYLSTAFIFDLDLYKEDVDIPQLSVTDKVQEQVIEEYAADAFLQEMQKFVMNGYDLDLESIWWDSTGVKTAKMILSDNPLIKDWTEEELKELTYEELKVIASYRNCFHRAKGVMIAAILKSNTGGFYDTTTN
jgi:hypothetical protein